MTTSKGVFLDVDSSLVEKNLKIATDPHEEEFNKLFKPLGDQFPSKLVKPYPGFCVKTKEVGSGTKFFVNVCQTDAIPPPKDITEKELRGIIESEDASSFRVPMSLGEVRNEKDKKGEEAKACDIAIHPSFFKKIQESEIFKQFFMAIIFQGLENKYGVVCTDEKFILKNRTVFGNLTMHRIEQREIQQKMKEYNPSKPVIETISSTQNDIRIPEYRLFRRKEEPIVLMGEFKFPDIISANDVTVDIGEDRILIEAPSKNYLVDTFVPLIIRQGSCSASFNKATKILTVKMPLLGG